MGVDHITNILVTLATIVGLNTLILCYSALEVQNSFYEDSCIVVQYRVNRSYIGLGCYTSYRVQSVRCNSSTFTNRLNLDKSVTPITGQM